MRKAKVYGVSLTDIKRNEDDIYTIYTTDEILNMDNVSDVEKQDVEIYANLCPNIIGWAEDDYSNDDDLQFTQVFEDEVKWLGDNEE